MNWESLLLALIIYLFVGVCSGLLSGLLGIGGGLVTVPALMLVFQFESINPALEMHIAVGTALATMVPITFRSLRSHMKYDNTFLPIYKKLIPTVITGIVFGALIARHLDSHALKIIFGLFTLCMAILLYRQNVMIDNPKKLPGRMGMSFAGGFIGLQSGMLGVGGGSFTVPFLTNRGVDIRVALMVSVSIAMTVATIGALGYMLIGLNAVGLPKWSTGFVYWPAFVGLAAGGIFMAPQGVKLSHLISKKKLKIFFVIFLLIVSAHMLWPV